ncbi:hypothetical protein FN846DRAFT_956436 [Sphaerosporella brunnea]|uniref:Uncharacterized protein n=1 Tax=Sphaerosporella brunnea TaxID=1250544 RepID=A0A5J5ERU2_9PEZI|nr:hypothetical protein FN846DRAFT_956436 [Sphaerosporella brunnea]
MISKARRTNSFCQASTDQPALEPPAGLPRLLYLRESRGLSVYILTHLLTWAWNHGKRKGLPSSSPLPSTKRKDRIRLNLLAGTTSAIDTNPSRYFHRRTEGKKKQTSQDIVLSGRCRAQYRRLPQNCLKRLLSHFLSSLDGKEPPPGPLKSSRQEETKRSLVCMLCHPGPLLTLGHFGELGRSASRPKSTETVFQNHVTGLWQLQAHCIM